MMWTPITETHVHRDTYRYNSSSFRGHTAPSGYKTSQARRAWFCSETKRRARSRRVCDQANYGGKTLSEPDPELIKLIVIAGGIDVGRIYFTTRSPNAIQAG